MLGAIGNTLIALSKKNKFDIPPIQCLVVNKQTELPGEGVGWFIDKNKFKKLSTRKKEIIVDNTLAKIYSFTKWDEILVQLSLTPLTTPHNTNNLVKKAQKNKT